MSIAGVKQTEKENDVFLSIVDKNEFKGQVASVVVVNHTGKQLGRFVDVFEDGTIYFYPNNKCVDGIDFDEDGRIFARSNTTLPKQSKLPIERIEKTDIRKSVVQEKFKTFPIVRVVSPSCCGLKSGCSVPLTITMSFNTSTCPASAVINIKNYFNGSSIANLFTIDITGKYCASSGISSGYALDLDSNNMVKIRGKLPLFYKP
jgi:hypothetical protein